ncbi:hypothetical protein ACHAXT_007955 [Thalassiosira profunda]
MEDLSTLNAGLKAALDSHERSLKGALDKLDAKESTLKEKQEALAATKLLDRIHANPDAADSDLVEVNAGGMILALRRSTLTQIKGARFEALFSGRWDKKLQKDSKGRLFLDVNPVCFQAIVDHLSELAIASAENPASPPCVGDEYKHILGQHLELFGLCTTSMPESNIVKTAKEAEWLHEWLEEERRLEPLYRGSRDGLSNNAFHSSCDDKGCTLTVIETTDGYVLGGYSNTPVVGTKPTKLFLNRAFYWGPAFSNLKVDESKVFVSSEIEVFRVSSGETTLFLTKGVPDVERELPQVEPFTQFTKDVNEALNAKQNRLLQLEDAFEDETGAFEDERNFINGFAGGDAEDVIALNVNGKMMTTHRATLQAIEDSVLARQFDASVWTEQGIGPRVKTWTPDDVASWADNIRGVPDIVGMLLKANDITGPELLAMNMERLEKLGIERYGTQFLLLEEIKGLKEASQNVVAPIQHSPYCFGKIVDFLRQKRLHSLGLAEEPVLPEIRDEQKSRFENVVRYYFPGSSANLLLGEAASAPPHANKRRKTSEET